MFMLRIVLLLLSCNMADMSRDRSRNTRISAQVKDQILGTDNAEAAYALYVRSYEDRNGPMMLRAVDPWTQQTEMERKKVNFLKSFSAVKDHNSKFETGESRFRMTVNAFSVMDKQERRKYLGVLNATKSDGKRMVTSLRGQNYPDTLSWYTKGYITDSFDQGDCGSCWSFPAVALLEFAVKDVTGKLIQLSNQQLLDCTYEHITDYGDHNGCEGGLYENAWDFIIATQHIAPLAKYKYRESDNKCDYHRYSNELESKVKITGHKSVHRSTEGLLEAIQLMPLAVAIYAEDELYAYYKGLFDGCREYHSDPDHAVLLTGYGTNYWEIRNSWGPDWGINGYFKFFRGRGVDLCLLLDYAAYITYENLKGYTGSDEPTSATKITTNTAYTRSDTPATTAQQSSVTSEDGMFTTKYSEVSTKYQSSTTVHASEHESSEFYTTVVTVKTNPSEKSSEFTEFPTVTEFPTRVTDFPTDPIKSTTTIPKFSTEVSSPPKVITDLISTAGIIATQVLTTEYVEECDRGYYWTGHHCEICIANFYSSYGARFCISCPDGTFSKEGSTSAQDCVEPMDECTDTYGDCSMWAGYGYCTVKLHGDYISFMETECRKSCRYCVDHCDAGYYRWNDGQCQMCPENTYSEYKSDQCTACPARTSSPAGSTDISNCIMDEVCEDSTPTERCNNFVLYGYCDTRRKLMERKCAKSCGFCIDDDTNDCLDMYYTAQCQDWKAQRLCYDAEFGQLTRKFCGKTCGTCRRAGEETRKCFDEEEYARDCPAWAQLGYCDVTSEYVGFMMKSCKKSCSGCEEKGDSTMTTVKQTRSAAAEPHTSTSRAVVDDCWINNSGISDNIIIYRRKYTTLDNCIDHCKARASCKGIMVSPAYISYWAYRECFGLGEEVVGTRYGWTAAKRSCFEPNYDTEVQTTDDKVCADSTEYESDCSGWAYYYCETGAHVDFMMQHCRKSCGICVTATASSCKDAKGTCKALADNGHCTTRSHKEWMRQNCARSCGVCEEVSQCSDTDQHAHDCGYWADEDYCNSGQYVDFMRENCAGSCGRCDESGGEKGRGGKGSKKKGGSRNRGHYGIRF